MKASVLSLVVLASSAVGLAHLPTASAASFWNSAATAKKAGTVQRYLLNPEGDVDGFLLSDGMQVKFPPHLSASLVALVAPNDKVELTGNSENDKAFRAEKIVNVASGKSLVDTPPEKGAGPRGRPPGPPPAPGAGAAPGSGTGSPPLPPGRREGLQELSAQGKVQTQLFGPRGEVNGVILSDESIVRFPPHLASDLKAKVDVGQNLKASGFGTKTAYGQALEATQLNNN